MNTQGTPIALPLRLWLAVEVLFGIGSLLLSRQQTWPALRIVVSGFFVLALGVLIASTIHSSLFSFVNPATWIWFGGFALLLVLHASMILLNRTQPGPTQ